MKKNRLLRVVGILLSFFLLTFAAFHLFTTQEVLQYLTIAPVAQSENEGEEEIGEPKENKKKFLPFQALIDLEEKLDEVALSEWEMSIKTYAIEGIVATENFTSEKGGAIGRLRAIGKNSLSVYPLTAKEGRLIYPEEFSSGEKVALVDEKMVLNLFKASSPIDKIVTIQGEEYKVVGIVRHQKKIGDEHEGSVYIPFRSLAEQAFHLDTLMVSAIPVPGSGAGSAFKSVLENQMQMKGTFINLKKETVGEMMPLRVMAFIFGLIAIFACIKRLNQKVLTFISWYKKRLKSIYAIRLVPKLLGAIVLFCIGYGVIALGLAKLVQFVVEPVYTFPEWIPDILVSWKSIQKTFWNLWQEEAQMIRIFSPELLNVRFYGKLLFWATGGFSLLLVHSYHLIKREIVQKNQKS